MSKPILYYIDYAPPSRSVALTIKALNLDVEYKSIDVSKDEHLKPEFLKLNPQHTLPTLDDNGAVIWDSHAIITYLAEKYGDGGSLYPNDLQIRTTINQRLHYDSSVIAQKWYNIVVPIYRHGATEFSEEALKAINDVYDLLEIFVKGGYMVGDNLTVADFAIISTLSGLIRLNPTDTTKHPRLYEWIKRICHLPYYAEISGKFVEVMNKKVLSIIEENKRK